MLFSTAECDLPVRVHRGRVRVLWCHVLKLRELKANMSLGQSISTMMDC